MLTVAEVSPAHGRDFKLGFFPAVVAGGRPVDGPVWNLVSGEVAASSKRECRLKKDVRLMPIDLVVDIHHVAFGAEGESLYEFGILQVARDADAWFGRL